MDGSEASDQPERYLFSIAAGQIQDLSRPSVPVLFFLPLSSIGCVSLGFLAYRRKISIQKRAIFIALLALGSFVILGYVIYHDQFLVVNARLPLISFAPCMAYILPFS